MPGTIHCTDYLLKTVFQYFRSISFITRTPDGNRGVITETKDNIPELGAPSVPTVETLRKFIPEEDLWPIGDVWYYHDLHYESFDWKNYIRDVEKLGQAPSRNADEFCSRAQFINYNLYRNMFEAWNQKMWNYASGLLLWMSHPAWPSMIWQTYSYDYETHGSFYGAKKACEPIHVQWNSVNKKLQVVNTTLENIPDAKVFFRVYDLKGKQLYEKKISVELEANKLTDCMEIALPPEIRDVSLVRTQLSDRRGKTFTLIPVAIFCELFFISARINILLSFFFGVFHFMRSSDFPPSCKTEKSVGSEGLIQ